MFRFLLFVLLAFSFMACAAKKKEVKEDSVENTPTVQEDPFVPPPAVTKHPDDEDEE